MFVEMDHQEITDVMILRFAVATTLLYIISGDLLFRSNKKDIGSAKISGLHPMSLCREAWEWLYEFRVAFTRVTEGTGEKTFVKDLLNQSKLRFVIRHFESSHY